MMVDPDRAAGHLEHNGKTYYFCSKGCVAKFTAGPETYLSGKREPMHAQTIQLAGSRRAAAPLEPPEPRKPLEHLEPLEPLERHGTRWTCQIDTEIVSYRPGCL